MKNIRRIRKKHILTLQSKHQQPSQREQKQVAGERNKNQKHFIFTDVYRVSVCDGKHSSKRSDDI